MLSLQLKTPTQASPAFPSAPLAQQVFSASALAQSQPWELASLIQLNFSELQSFEVVRNQYQQWGIEFEQTIALQPSNPAFADSKQPVGLMPIAHPYMAVQFDQPRQFVKANLAGARTILVTVFDAEDRVIARYDLERDAPNSNSIEPTLPLHTLHLQAATIGRIEITSAAPFMLQSFCCI